MTATEYIENAIKKIYGNKRKFSEQTEIPYMTISSVLSRGVESSGVNTVMKICEALDIPVSELFKLSTFSQTNKNKPTETTADLTNDELHLISVYKKLSVNSKQIVMNLAKMEVRHISANEQGEHLTSILKNSHSEAKKEYLKVYDQPAAAGYGNYVDDDNFELIAVSSIPRGVEFGVRISGDSMEPHIHDKDIVFVKRQHSIEVGEIGIFLLDGEAYCKQLKFENGKYYLHSLNARYSDIPIDSDIENFYCSGKVIL